MKDDTAGDPITGLKWTRKTRAKIADELKGVGISVSPATVGRLLRSLDFSLKCNSKKVSNGGRRLTKDQSVTRDRQFRHIERTRSKFVKKHQPVISVDTKKKELIGNFKNPGTRYKKTADLVNDHDFAQYALGKTFPYGIYDEARNEGVVYVGQSLWDRKKKRFTSKETPQFAAESVTRWWREFGMARYPGAKELLILADSGGSNGYRSRMWKLGLQDNLSSKYGLKVTVCHYPPGASKWNRIEHRLFSEISKNWKGVPLTTFETVLKHIRTTKTKTGLKTYARTVTKTYHAGKSVSKTDFERIRLTPHKLLPSWNYSIDPVQSPD
jgi:hypothetical protein